MRDHFPFQCKTIKLSLLFLTANLLCQGQDYRVIQLTPKLFNWYTEQGIKSNNFFLADVNTVIRKVTYLREDGAILFCIRDTPTGALPSDHVIKYYDYLVDYQTFRDHEEALDYRTKVKASLVAAPIKAAFATGGNESSTGLYQSQTLAAGVNFEPWLRRNNSIVVFAGGSTMRSDQEFIIGPSVGIGFSFGLKFLTNMQLALVSGADNYTKTKETFYWISIAANVKTPNSCRRRHSTSD